MRLAGSVESLPFAPGLRYSAWCATQGRRRMECRPERHPKVEVHPEGGPAVVTPPPCESGTSDLNMSEQNKWLNVSDAYDP